MLKRQAMSWLKQFQCHPGVMSNILGRLLGMIAEYPSPYLHIAFFDNNTPYSYANDCTGFCNLAGYCGGQTFCRALRNFEWYIFPYKSWRDNSQNSEELCSLI